MIDRATHTCSPSPRPLVQAIRAALGSRAMTQTTSAAGLALLLAVPMAASAADFTVANRNDSGPGSLRQAVLDANATPGLDTIRFDSSVTGTIALTSGALIVTNPLTLDGPGRDLLTLDGSAVPSILQVENALTIAHLKLANAAGDAINASTDGGQPVALVDSMIQGSTAAALDAHGADLIIANSIITRNGRGILLQGTYWMRSPSLSVSDSIIADNGDDGIFCRYTDEIAIDNSTISGNTGGGIYVDGASAYVYIDNTTVSGNENSGISTSGYYARSLYVEDSVISGNGGHGVDGTYLNFQRCTIANNSGRGINVSAFSHYYWGEADVSDSTIKENGGGMEVNGYARIRNSTITNNRSPFNGAGILNFGWVGIANSTITGNVSEGSGGGLYDSLYSYYTSYGYSYSTISNSIIAGNQAAADPDLAVHYSDVTYSLIRDPGQSAIQDAAPGTNIIGQDPLLDALANNGGPTETHALRRGSPAIDRGDPDMTPPPDFDQRGPGFDRRINARIDMGAVEAPVSVWLQSPGDINADGRPEIATVARIAGRNLATVKDAANGALISQFEFSAALHPVAVETLPASGQHQTPHLVLLGGTPAQAETRNALTGDVLGSVNFAVGAVPVDLTVLSDQDGNGIQDLAMLATGSTKIRAVDGVTERIVDWDSRTDEYNYAASISADGRFVAFASGRDNLVPGDTNGVHDAFVYDRATGTTERVSLGANGAQANYYSDESAISADGRFVAFSSNASNLVPGDTNGEYDVFVHDRVTGTTERVSLGANGVQLNGSIHSPTISADGRFVAFISDASNLVPGDTNGTEDVFVRDRTAGTTERVSLGDGRSGPNYLRPSPLSADGRFLAYYSDGSNLVPGDTNGTEDIFVRDRTAGTTERVSLGANGAQANSSSWGSAISADGRFVAFASYASNLVPGDTNGTEDVFVRDRATGTTERVSLGVNGTQGDGWSYRPGISADGRFVAFASYAGNLVPGDTNGTGDVFVHDRATKTTRRVSISTCGIEGNRGSDAGLGQMSISADGAVVAFVSSATNLVPDRSIVGADLFVRTLTNDARCSTVVDSTQIEVRDAVTDRPINTVRFSAQLTPRQVLALPDLHGRTRVGMLAGDAQGDRVVIKDAGTGALVQSLWAGRDVLQAEVSADRNGNGAPELALLRRRVPDGTPEVRVMDAATSEQLASLNGFNKGFTPLQLVVLADVNGNGVEDYAVLSREPGTHQVSVSLKDGATGQPVNRFSIDKACDPLDMVRIADLNGNGAEELVVLGRCGTNGPLRAFVKDAKTGQLLNRVDF